MATFSPSTCGVSSGISLAAQQTTSKLDQIHATALATLNQALAAASDLDAIGFPKVNFGVNFDNSGQLEEWAKPDRPELDYDLLDVRSDLAAPGDIELDDLGQFNLNGDKPPFSRSVPTALVDTLIDMLSGLTGLPLAWEEATWNRARDRLSRELGAQERELAGEYSRRGWSAPTGVETARIDAARQTFFEQVSAVSRDVAIKAFEEALASLRMAAQLGVQYLEAWVEMYAAQIRAESEYSLRIIQGNEARIQKLRALIAVFDSKVRLEQTRIGAVSQAFDTEARLYSADAGISDSISRRDAAAFDVETRRRELDAQKQLQQNAANIATRERDVQEAVTNSRNRAAVLSQVNAALWQAINVGASISSAANSTDTTTCSTTYTYEEKG